MQGSEKQPFTGSVSMVPASRKAGARARLLARALAVGLALVIAGCAGATQPAAPASTTPSDKTTAPAAQAPAAPQPIDYPTKDLELMIPFAPGGGLDLFGRTVAKVLAEEKLFTRPIQITNKAGAGGSVGMAELVTKRKGDEYSLATFALHVHLTPLAQGTPHSYKHLTPIAKLFSEHTMMVVRKESPIKTLKDLEALLKQDPGAVKFGGATAGNVDHMTAVKFAKELGIPSSKLTYIAYSGGESNAAILGGHVDVGLGGLDLIDLVEGGKMRVLAVTSEKRLGGKFKDFPTFKEQGYNVVFQNWRGLFGPPDMPPAVLKWWRETLSKMTQTPSWKAELEKNQWEDTFETDTFLASLDKEHELYRALLQELGLLKQ